MAIADDVEALAGVLSAAGFVAAEDEADELLVFAAGDRGVLDRSVQRRLAGEPLAWIIGSVAFCDREVRVDPGVYVPRWQSTVLALRAAEWLPADGVAIDLCTGAGAMARILMDRRPGARVVATEIDDRSVACAAANGVEVYGGDLFAPLPDDLYGCVDVIVGVVPYVPTAALAFLPRDTLTFETPLSYDGGVDGTVVLRRVVDQSPPFLRAGGALLLELGGEQADVLAHDLEARGFIVDEVLVDDEGDVRGVAASLS